MDSVSDHKAGKKEVRENLILLLFWVFQKITSMEERKKKWEKNILERWRGRNEPDHCGKVTLTQRHRTDKELPLVNSAIWHTPAYSDTRVHAHTQALTSKYRHFNMLMNTVSRREFNLWVYLRVWACFIGNRASQATTKQGSIRRQTVEGRRHPHTPPFSELWPTQIYSINQWIRCQKLSSLI